MLNSLDLLSKLFPKALNHALPSKKKNNHNNFFDVCQAKEKVCDIKETLCRSAASQYNCGPARLVLINGSPSPELVSRWLTPPAASNYSSSISPPQLCLWISIVQKMCLLCRIWDSPPPRAKKPATCVNHTLLVRWSSVRGLHGNSDVTHTELAQGQLPHRMINKRSGERSQALFWWMIAWVDCGLRSCGLMMWVTLQGANHHDQLLINSIDEQFIITNRTNCSNN